MFKRPIIRPRVAGRAPPPFPVPHGFPSIVGRLSGEMRSKEILPPRSSRWVPSVDYEFLANQLPPSEREAYIQKSLDWFAENAAPAEACAAEKFVPDDQCIVEALAKYARVHSAPGRPAPKDMANAMRAAGYSETRIAKYLQWCQNMEDTAEERQEALDKIFAKYPSASKPDPKPKVKKVIKAVVKRMTNE